MNLNLKLDGDYKKYLPLLRQAQPYIFGLVLIGVFGYTLVQVNAALNVKAAQTTAAATTASKIKFDKSTIDAVKKPRRGDRRRAHRRPRQGRPV